MHLIILTLYLISMTGILLYCLLQLTLAFRYIRYRKENNPGLPDLDLGRVGDIPAVTIQLPLYNERYVAERLIRSVLAINYPKEKLEIQVLDDSTDDTVEIVSRLISEFQNDYQVKHIRRSDRKHFKAGALQHGLDIAKGGFIAIFDADFIPDRDFLIKTLPYFADPEVGMVQSRWEHLNRDLNLLTHLQAFAIDVHFSIEQTGRNSGGYFMNFNGTGGIWRKETIVDAGGWSAETLTEDLDLSYRAQLKGWKFKYLEGLASPAELPAEISSYKTQQFRWNKGGAETAKKILPKVIRSEIPFMNKVHAFAHLLNSSVYLFVLSSILLSLPMIFVIKNYFSEGYFYLSFFLLASIATAMVFFIALYSRLGSSRKTIQYYLWLFPSFIAVNIGMSLYISIAVLKGYFGIKSSFIRTPKFNVSGKSDAWKSNIYLKHRLNLIAILEGILALYFFFGIWLGINQDTAAMIPLHILAGLGFSIVFLHSVHPLLKRT